MNSEPGHSPARPYPHPPKELERSAGRVQAPLESSDCIVKYVRLLFCDTVGLRRCKVIPAASLDEAKTKGVGLAKAVMGLQVWADACAPGCGLGAVGEVRMVPADTAVQLPWHPGHAICLTSMHTPPGSPWSCCARSALAKTLAHAREHGFDCRVGFETEFQLLTPALESSNPPGYRPVDSSMYCESSAFDHMSPVMDAIADSLQQMGTGVEMMHVESGHGQFEIVTTHTDPLQAADRLLLTREAITGVASRAGFRASLHPKPDPNGAGSACHCHISLTRAGELMDDGHAGLTCWGRAFFAGILAHLPALMVFTMPCLHSYHRMQAGTWAGAYRMWGNCNKEAPLRFCRMEGHPQMTNMELKCVDNTTNPYIALAAIITTGLLGIEEKLDLPPPCDLDPASWSEEQTKELGYDALPTSLAAALQALHDDKDMLGALRETLGPELLNVFMQVKGAEAKHFATESDEVLYTRF